MCVLGLKVDGSVDRWLGRLIGRYVNGQAAGRANRCNDVSVG